MGQRFAIRSGGVRTGAADGLMGYSSAAHLFDLA